MAKNILYISYDGLTDPLGQSQILPYITKLSGHGFNFTILSAEKTNNYKRNKTTINQICKQYKIDWHPIIYTKKPPVLSTIKDIIKIKKLAFKLHENKNFKAVHCRSYIPAIIGLQLKQKKNIKFIFDMRGFWADERIDGKIWDIKKFHYKLIYKYFKKKEKQFLSQADAIVSLTHAGKKIITKQWHCKNKVYVIPCAVDTKMFKPYNNTINTTKLTLVYLGSIGTWYMLDEMLDFFQIMLKKYPDAIFKFITKESSSLIINKAKQKNINKKNIVITQAERTDVPKKLKDADLGIFFIKPTFSKQASSPVKQGEFMSMGIPVIANSGIGDTDEIINKYNAGILINKFTTEAYEAAVNKIPEIIKIPKNKLHTAANDYFSLINSSNTYLQLYNEVLEI